MHRIVPENHQPSVHDVTDRKVPTTIESGSKKSGVAGAKGKGTNKQTMNESLRDLGQAPHLDGDADCPGCSGREH